MSAPKPPAMPPGPRLRPSIFSRIGMVGLLILPSLLGLGLVAWGIDTSNHERTGIGALILLLLIGLTIMAQTSTSWRTAAQITFGILSGLILAAAGVAVVLLALLYAACSGR
jgi:hypothetical protein